MSATNSILNSYKWVMLARWIGRVAGIVSTLILVRILTPDDYGIAAQALFVLMLFDALSHTGTEQFVIKQTSLTDDCLFTSWTLNLILKLITAILIFGFSSQIAAFLNEDRLSDVLKVVALVAIFSSLKSPALIVLKRNMRFQEVSKVEIISKLTTVLLTIGLGVTLQTYWALIWANVFSSILVVLISYKIAPIKIRLTLANIKEQAHFAKGIFLTSLIGYIRAKLDILIISKKFGASSAGNYSLGQEFSLLPYTEAIAPLTQPLYSSLSKVKNNNTLLQKQLFKYMSISYALVIPSAAGIFCLSDSIVDLLFGPQWADAIPVMSYLAILMVTFVTNGSYKIVFTLKSQFLGIALLDIIGILLIASAFFIERILSVGDFAMFRGLVGVSVLLTSILLAKMLLKYKIKLALIAMFIPTLSSVGMVIFLVFYKPIVEQWININWLSLLFLIASSAIIYIVTWLILMRLCSPYHYIWKFNTDLMRELKQTAFQKFNKSN